MSPSPLAPFREEVALKQWCGFPWVASLTGARFPSLICQWAGQENADFRATDSGAFVSNVVLRIVGQSVARAPLGH